MGNYTNHSDLKLIANKEDFTQCIQGFAREANVECAFILDRWCI